jgi:hypothetical protein
VQAAGFTEALTCGSPSLDARLRYETVDQDNALDEADALTLRARLGYTTGAWMNANGFLELEHTSALVEDYNSGPGGNGKTRYSVVADPEITEVNQAFIGYTGVPGTSIRAGRQRIVLDNARFVGNVGWRQNEQTYDAFMISNGTLPDTTLSYALLGNARTIQGEDIDISTTHLVNASYKGLPFGTLTAYGYFIEFDDAPAGSQQTLGARFDGALGVDAAKLLYTLELAKQSDYADGDSGIDADYRHLVLGATVSGITGSVGYELLGADDFSGFETPLATKHAFNGWADVFLNTPVDGLQDAYVSLAGAVKGVKLLAVWHDFEADKGSLDYGTELDLQAQVNFGKHYAAGAKYARYDADDFFVDTDKFWLWGEARF